MIETLINTLYSGIRRGTSMRDREPLDSVDGGSPRGTQDVGCSGSP
ncbi:MAG: hypothetical protein QXV95_05485 [Sulfolobales archaeon]